ncbi:MAG: hypothetical protein K2Y56_11575 [Methylobacterium sp.]|nr:hypothetical protein [Methylobacterium sp.]
MPRYYFDMTAGGLCGRDEEGSDFPDLEAARREAVGALPEIARFSLDKGNDKSVAVKVRDEKGAVLFQAALTLTEQWMGAPSAG